MRSQVMTLGMMTAALAWAPLALAADNQAGTPLAPADAAGPWTLESGGHAICVVSLSTTKAGKAGFAVKVPAQCSDALPAGPAGWRPTADGMSLVDAGGQDLIKFNRWSNSLFVSHRSSGVDIQLKRGGPNG